ncbi:placenta-expressed transcript 1 protein-like [Emydura macquarii macquarii]|uniref:placenta-expressed transcript 1 protein-like n=1 Tax=Emydura macquarii macquarii TaxID=1129001 RepID=UPI00352AE66A
MAALTSTLQLLFLGALISPVYLQDACTVIAPTTPLVTYNLSVNPTVYQASTTYNVTVSGATNSTSVILQAINQSTTVGQWQSGSSVNCSNGQSAAQKNISSSATVQWTSPANWTGPVEIRALVTFSNNSNQFQKTTLNTASTTPSPVTTKTTTPSSVSTAKPSSFLLAAIQLLSVFVTGKLFSC